MSDFDWYGTCAAVHGSKACQAVLCGDTQGNIYSSYPLADDGNYKFWVFADAYKALVTKEDGTEEEQDIYEAYNLGLLLSGQKSSIPAGQGIRINGDKYMHVRVQPKDTYTARIVDAEGNETTYPVTIDEVHVLKKGKIGIMMGVKNGYFFATKFDEGEGHTGPKAAEALAIGFYWAVGPDA